MDVFFVENCELCNCSEIIREYEYFYDGTYHGLAQEVSLDLVS